MAIVPVAEEAASATGLLTWIARATGIAAPLADLLFGRGRSEPARNNAIGPAAALLKAPAHVLNALFGQSVSLARHVYATMVTNFTQIANNLYLETAGRVRQVNAEALSRWRHDREGIAHTDRKVGTEALSRWRADQRVAAQAHEQLLTEASTRYRHDQQVRAEAHGWVTDEALSRYRGDYAERVHTDTVAAALKTYADTTATRAAARSTAKLSSEVGAATHPDYAGMRSDLEAAAAVFGAGMPAITRLIGRVPTAAPDTAPAAAAAESAITRVLTKTMADCVAPTCRDLSKYGRDLKDLFGLVEGAAMIAFIAEMIRDPVGTARVTVDVLEPPLHATVSAFERLIGA